MAAAGEMIRLEANGNGNANHYYLSIMAGAPDGELTLDLEERVDIAVRKLIVKVAISPTESDRAQSFLNDLALLSLDLVNSLIAKITAKVRSLTLVGLYMAEEGRNSSNLKVAAHFEQRIAQYSIESLHEDFQRSLEYLREYQQLKQIWKAKVLTPKEIEFDSVYFKGSSIAPQSVFFERALWFDQHPFHKRAKSLFAIARSWPPGRSWEFSKISPIEGAQGANLALFYDRNPLLYGLILERLTGKCPFCETPKEVAEAFADKQKFLVAEYQRKAQKKSPSTGIKII